MKKSLLILSALMALSMAFVGCKGGSDPVQDPAGEDTKNGIDYKNVYVVDYGSGSGSYNKNTGVISLGAGQYKNVVIELSEPTDFSKGVKVKCSVSDYELAETANGLKFVFASDATIGKDSYGYDAIDGTDKCEGYPTFPATPDVVEFKIEPKAAWGADNPADLKKVNFIQIAPQQCTGTFVVEWIEPITE